MFARRIVNAAICGIFLFVFEPKIIILNGSPRKNGNTSGLVQSFAKGAREAGHTVTEFFLNDMNIHGCLGCFGDEKKI